VHFDQGECVDSSNHDLLSKLLAACVGAALAIAVAHLLPSSHGPSGGISAAGAALIALAIATARDLGTNLHARLERRREVTEFVSRLEQMAPALQEGRDARIPFEDLMSVSVAGRSWGLPREHRPELEAFEELVARIKAYAATWSGILPTDARDLNRRVSNLIGMLKS
jgi:hypothetical protein